MSHVQFDREKLKQVILYACLRCDPARLGAVKLQKILYFSDMLHYAHVGSPITGATYRKRPHGPTCDAVPSLLSELEREKLIKITDVDYFGYRKKEFRVNGSPNLDRLSDQEQALLNEVIEFVCENNTARTISEFSHNRAWDLADFGGVLKYNSVFLIFPNQVSEEALNWGASEAKRLATEKSNGKSISRNDFGDFRKRVLSSFSGS